MMRRAADGAGRPGRSSLRTWRTAGLALVAAGTAAVALGAFQAGQPSATGNPPTCAVRYVANAGVLLHTGGRTVLVDGLVREGIPPYAVPEEPERRQLERAEPPFSNVSVVLVTHWHEDHFSPDAVAAHLRNNARSVLVSSAEVVDRVRAVSTGLPLDRLRGVTPRAGTSERVVIDGLTIHVLRIRHNPARRQPEEHVGFLVEGCRTFLHVGDADPAADNFQLLRALPSVDVGILPFWYVLSERSRAFVQESIRPRRVIGMHLPPRDAADARGRTPPEIRLLVTPGTVVDLGGQAP
jgi:L-ascorbate metabolism protein UlaG (beta-lactamase superfamily)